MKPALLLLASYAAWAVTATPTSITSYMMETGTYGTPGGVNFPPLDVPITVIGTGSWGLARGGTLGSMCSGGPGYCFTISSSSSGVATTCPDNLPSGSGATTLYLCWKPIPNNAITPGTYTGTATVGSTTISLTLIVLARNVFNAWLWPSASYPSGCTTGSGYDTPNNCTITNERPTSESFSIPAVSGSYTDPQFGYTVTRVTTAGQFLAYSTIRALNADDTYIFTTDGTGNVNIYPKAGGAAAYSAVSGAREAYTSWDSSNANRLWSYNASVIQYVQLNSSPTPVTAANYASSSGSRPAFTNLDSKGTADITADNWWVFVDQGTTRVCAVNLTGLTTGTQEAQTYCANYSTTTLASIDYPNITQVDSESRKRYVAVMGSPHDEVWSVNLTTGVLDYEYEITTGGMAFPGGPPHSDTGQDEFGRQFMYLYQSSAWQNNWLSKFYFNKGPDFSLPVTVGGGFAAIAETSYGADGHFGCAWNAACVMESSYYYNQTAQAVTTLTTGSPCQINKTSHGYSTSNSIQIGGALGSGATVINGIWTITVLNVNAYTIPVSCAGATYTSNSGSSVLSVAPTGQNFRSEIQVIRPGGESLRLAIGRFIGYEGNSLTFYRTNYAFPSISKSGRYVVFNSNFGVPEQPSTYIIDIGYPVTTAMSAWADPADTKVILSYSFPIGYSVGSATITISASPNLGSPVVSASDGLATTGRQYVATGLTAATQYYYRIATTQWAFTGQFTTIGTLSGTGRLQLAKGGGGTINYGVTSGLGSSCSSPCDLAPSKGLLYTNSTGAASAVVVR